MLPQVVDTWTIFLPCFGVFTFKLDRMFIVGCLNVIFAEISYLNSISTVP